MFCKKCGKKIIDSERCGYCGFENLMAGESHGLKSVVIDGPNKPDEEILKEVYSKGWKDGYDQAYKRGYDRGLKAGAERGKNKSIMIVFVVATILTVLFIGSNIFTYNIGKNSVSPNSVSENSVSQKQNAKNQNSKSSRKYKHKRRWLDDSSSYSVSPNSVSTSETDVSGNTLHK